MLCHRSSCLSEMFLYFIHGSCIFSIWIFRHRPIIWYFLGCWSLWACLSSKLLNYFLSTTPSFPSPLLKTVVPNRQVYIALGCRSSQLMQYHIQFQVLIITGFKWIVFLHSVHYDTLKHKDGKKKVFQVNTICSRFVHLKQIAKNCADWKYFS